MCSFYLTVIRVLSMSVVLQSINTKDKKGKERRGGVKKKEGRNIKTKIKKKKLIMMMQLKAKCQTLRCILGNCGLTASTRPPPLIPFQSCPLPSPRFSFFLPFPRPLSFHSHFFFFFCFHPSHFSFLGLPSLNFNFSYIENDFHSTLYALLEIFYRIYVLYQILNFLNLEIIFILNHTSPCDIF